ncbi:MAG: hypothetical protein KIT27_08350 [Legionellales bacterium]|nr:hypothetical protein [Legionellales bacterium]
MLENFDTIFNSLYQNRTIKFVLGEQYCHEKLTQKQADLGLLLLKHGDPTLVMNELNISVRSFQYHIQEIREKFNNKPIFVLPFELLKVFQEIYQNNVKKF